MNVPQSNDFAIPIFGAFYLADFTTFRTAADTTLSSVYAACAGASPAPFVNQMLTLPDVLTAFSAAPAGLVRPCSFADINLILPGLQSNTAGVPAPAWTHRVHSECYMIGQDLYPYYCQVWYDWDYGAQLTVFVQKDTPNATLYNQRFDELLPKGKIGPAIVYAWDGTNWQLTCCQAGQSFVPMPVPTFVAAGHGKCRALFSNDAYFGNSSIWSVQLGGGGHSSDFWYSFDDRQRGVIFSLSPAGSLTLIDYQSFDQNTALPDCMFIDPSDQVPPCQPTNVMANINRMSWTHRIF
jgi:hypothetical protein